MDVRVLLQSVMSTQGRALIYGVTPVDIHCMLMKVVEEHRVRGRNVGFTWKRVGLRKYTGKGWDVGSMKRTVLNKVGKKQSTNIEMSDLCTVECHMFCKKTTYYDFSSATVLPPRSAIDDDMQNLR